jgi:molecular chaperone DnaK
MSRVPAVVEALRQRLADRFTDAPEPRLIDPDQIVAKGAALFAAGAVAEQYDDDDPERPRDAGLVPGAARLPALVDITSRGYGVRARRSREDPTEYIEWIIKPQDELPASHTEHFQTLEHGQTMVEVVVYESATNLLSDDPDNNIELIRGDLTGLPPGKPPGQPLTIAHTLGRDGVLKIVATGPSGQELQLECEIRGAMPAGERARPLPVLVR